MRSRLRQRDRGRYGRRGAQGHRQVRRICRSRGGGTTGGDPGARDGYLEEVLFKEGDLIKEGAPLYRIEKGLFEAAVTAAEAAIERSKAAKILTEVQLRRAQDLLDKNSGTVVARDQAWPPINRPRGS